MRKTFQHEAAKHVMLTHALHKSALLEVKTRHHRADYTATQRAYYINPDAVGVLRTPVNNGPADEITW